MVSEYSEQKVLVCDDGCFVKFSAINDDLTARFCKSYDIMKVYGLTPNPSMSRSCKTVNRPLLWERKEITELTFEEIAKKFNVPVETLRIKE
jgi:alcohol dehydrogenase YqhD (iron-dependent ADH family)